MTTQVREVLIGLRKQRGLKQKDIATAIDITTSYYGMIELGKRTPQLELAKRIADFFGVKVEDIFFESTANNLLKKPTPKPQAS